MRIGDPPSSRLPQRAEHVLEESLTTRRMTTMRASRATQ
jgi:hypothetical protein